MSVKIDVFSDYVCPYCLLIEGVLAEATQGLNVDIQWQPFELRAAPTPTLRPEDDYLPQVWKKSVYPLAQRLGVPIQLPSISPQPYSRWAHEGFQVAEANGKADAYKDRMFRAFFQEDQDIGSLSVLGALADEVGLDKSQFLVALGDGKYTDRHEALLERAKKLGVQSVPSLYMDGQLIQVAFDPQVLRRYLLEKYEDASITQANV
ncbi:MAG TPA: hypothetical protein ENI05_08490 [Porticoccus sp.]|nr:hypothetical protein [Porticoccus sp.]